MTGYPRVLRAREVRADPSPLLGGPCRAIRKLTNKFHSRAVYLFNDDVSGVVLGIGVNPQSPLVISLCNSIQDLRTASERLISVRGLDGEDGGADGRVFGKRQVSILRRKQGRHRRQEPLAVKGLPCPSSFRTLTSHGPQQYSPRVFFLWLTM